MNRYLLKIPYSFLRFGTYSCTIIAETEEDALEKADNFETHNSEEYEDSDNDGDMDFNYDETDVELEESDVEDSDNDNNTFEKIPDYFLNEINLI